MSTRPRAKPTSFVKTTLPDEPALTAKQQALFTSEQMPDGTDRHIVVRMGDTLLGYHYDEDADPETKVIVHERKRTRSVPFIYAHEFTRVIPAPSGERFVIMSACGGDATTSIPGGHAVEVELSGLSTQVVITGTTGRTGGFMDPATFDDLPTLSTVDYAGDDDTIVAAIGTTKTQQLRLLKRDARARQFVEVSRIRVLQSENHLATAGSFIVTSGTKQFGIYQVVGDQIVKVGTVPPPSKYGAVFGYPADTRREIWLRDDDDTYRFVNLAGLVGATPPAAAKPKRSAPAPKRAVKKHAKR